MTGQVKTKCLICGEEVNDILNHYVFSHDLQNPDDFYKVLQREDLKKKRQVEFNALVKDLTERKRRGEISAEEYRQLQKEWEDKNPIS
ncbi:MAG: hypothetical protein V1875_04730 [Candidatus Altiarchaeota archaeon]